MTGWTGGTGTGGAGIHVVGFVVLVIVKLSLGLFELLEGGFGGRQS